MQGQDIRYLSEVIMPTGEGHAKQELPASPGRTLSHTLVGAGLALFLLVACGGAWVWLIGIRPCALSSLVWR